jgi:sulfonate transport system ATP-binding protein
MSQDMKAPTFLINPDRVHARAAKSGLSLAIDGVGKQFGDRQVLAGLRFQVPPSQFLAIVGRSGCGKSTLLRLLAGLETPSEGNILLNGRPPAQCLDDIRIMYQDARLLDWRSVAENVMLGLPGSRSARRALALEALDQVGLADRAEDWPRTLSGGQRQRVALARALTHRPRLLLLDEPLGALDALTRIEMQQLIERLWKTHGFTAVLVTHDTAEAISLADRVILIDDGKLALDVDASGLPRPRERGNADFAAMEGRVLSRLLQPPVSRKKIAA